MVAQNLRGVLGSKYKIYNHGSNISRSKKQKHIIDLEIFAQHLQRHFWLYGDHVSMENLMKGIGKDKIKEEKYDFYEEAL